MFCLTLSEIVTKYGKLTDNSCNCAEGLLFYCYSKHIGGGVCEPA